MAEQPGADKAGTDGSDMQLDAQATEQTGQRQVRLRIDDRSLVTNYANAFRTNGTAEEVMVDFGLNSVVPVAGSERNQQSESEILFKLSDRVILNYYTAKRLAITLGQLIRRHEDQFGELKLNVADRQKGGAPKST